MDHNLSDNASDRAAGEHRYNRLNTLGSTYWDICQTCFARYAIDGELAAEQPFDTAARSDLSRASYKAGLTAIVFGAMCLEAAIYDYSAIHLGDKYTAQNIDRLDLIAKWMVVPRLITGRELRVRGKAVQYLASLVRARNRLVHAKSVPLDFSKLTQELIDRHEQQFADDVVSSYRACCHVAAEIEVVHADWPSPLSWIKLDEDEIYDAQARHPMLASIRAEARIYRRECIG